MNTQLQVQNISKIYKDGKVALHATSLTIPFQSKVGFLGETGSGKSTLLRIIAGLEGAETGEVLFEGVRIKGPDEKLVPGHKDIIYLSQYVDLPKFITVEEYLDNSYHLSEDESFKINKSCFIEHLLGKDTSQLSGGEKQRVAFAKALTQTPKVLLLDEPFSNLDAIHKKVIKEVISEIEREFNTTMILVSHEAQDLLPWADTMFVMKDGRVAQTGTPTEIYYKPNSGYVAGLSGLYNLLNKSLFKSSENTHRTLIGDQVFIRPEELILLKNKCQNCIKGKVTSVAFMGSHDVIEFQSQSVKMASYAEHNTLQVGDSIYAEIATKSHL